MKIIIIFFTFFLTLNLYSMDEIMRYTIIDKRIDATVGKIKLIKSTHYLFENKFGKLKRVKGDRQNDIVYKYKKNKLFKRISYMNSSRKKSNIFWMSIYIYKQVNNLNIYINDLYGFGGDKLYSTAYYYSSNIEKPTKVGVIDYLSNSKEYCKFEYDEQNRIKKYSVTTATTITTFYPEYDGLKIKPFKIIEYFGNGKIASIYIIKRKKNKLEVIKKDIGYNNNDKTKNVYIFDKKNNWIRKITYEKEFDKFIKKEEMHRKIKYLK